MKTECTVCGKPHAPHLGYFYGAHAECAQKAIKAASAKRIAREERKALKEYHRSIGGAPPGYAGPAPDGMNYSDWLALNNID